MKEEGLFYRTCNASWQVNHTKRELHNVFIAELYREDKLERLMMETAEIAAKRQRLKEHLEVLEQARRALEELPLEVETVKKSYSSFTDSTALPNIHGLPPSFYVTSNGYTTPHSASPKNPKSSRKSAHSGEQPFYPNSKANGLGSYPLVNS